MTRKERAARFRTVCENVLKNADAMAFLAEVVAWAPPLASAYVAGDTHATAFVLGEKNLTQRIVGTLKPIAPDILARLDAALLPHPDKETPRDE